MSLRTGTIGRFRVWMIFKSELRSTEQQSLKGSESTNCPLLVISYGRAAFVAPTRTSEHYVRYRSNKLISGAPGKSIVRAIYCDVLAPSGIRYVANGFPMTHSSTINTILMV
jgi:hypothetical protein